MKKIIGLVLGMMWALPVWGQAPCTHWASPTGSVSSSQCTQASPCRIMTWLNTSAFVIPGATLCLNNGVYTGSESMISIPDTFNGTAEKPITIRALESGKVTIDGQDGSRPINTKGSYGVIQGVNAARGDNENIMIRGHHWLLKDIMTWNVGSAGDSNIHISGTDNTIEDCGSWGAARKPIAAGAAGGDRNTVRRCWARWEANLHMSSNPSNAIEMGYGQNTVTMENTIATWDTKGRVTEPEGVGELFSTKNSKWLGSIFYVTPNAVYAPSKLIFGTTDAGSHAQQGQFNPTSNLIFKHILAYMDPGHPKFASMKALYFAEGTDPGHPPGTGNVLSDLTSIAGLANTFSSSFPTSRVQHGSSIAAAIGTGKSMWLDSYAGPGICKRYINGQLTEQGLWPFPADKRISDALVQSGYPAMSVTTTMEQLFGPIPALCRSDDIAPVPPTNVQVEIRWTDIRNTTHTGYQVYRRLKSETGELSGYVLLPITVAPTARSMVDVQPVVGEVNCYAVATLSGTEESPYSTPDACGEVKELNSGNTSRNPVTDVTMTVQPKPHTP